MSYGNNVDLETDIDLTDTRVMMILKNAGTFENR